MDNPNSVRGLFIAAMFIAVMAVVLVVYLLFSPGTEAPPAEVAEQETVRLRPSDETVDRVVVSVAERPADEEYAEWQNPIQRPAPITETVIIRSDETDVGSPFTVNDLSHLDLGEHTDVPVPSAYTPTEPFVPAPPPDPSRFSPPEPGWAASSYVREEYDSLGRINFRECGEIIIPSGFGLMFFESRLDLYEGVICMGEAIGDRCDDARLYAMQEGEVIGEILITEFPDGSCAVGAAVEDNLLSICRFEDLANRNTEDTQSESAWIRDFAEEPGFQFAELYRNNNDVLGNPEVIDEFGCELFEYSE